MHGVRGLRLAVAGVAAVCLAGLAASSAAAATTISVGDARLVGNVVAQVPVTLTCGPLDPFSMGGTVTIQQAHNKAIANGQASFFAGPPIGETGNPSPIVCDGTAQQLTVSVSADNSGPYRSRTVRLWSPRTSFSPTR